MKAEVVVEQSATGSEYWNDFAPGTFLQDQHGRVLLRTFSSLILLEDAKTEWSNCLKALDGSTYLLLTVLPAGAVIRITTLGVA